MGLWRRHSVCMLSFRTRRPSEGELAAYADGTLSGRRRAQVDKALGESPELQEQVAEQRRAVEIVRAAAVDAPAELRARIPTRVTSARSRPSRRRPVALATGVCVVAVALAVALLSAGSSTPTVAAASLLSLRPATTSAPVGNTGHTLPGLRADGLPYPYWEDSFGWKAAGVRWDTLTGRKATTVFYSRGGQSLAYTIVSGSFLSIPPGTPWVTRNGTHVALIQLNGRVVAVWERHGHTCILSGRGVPAESLVTLASWH